jgi:hypothetical protein
MEDVYAKIAAETITFGLGDEEVRTFMAFNQGR